MSEWIVIRNWERHQHPDAARSQVPPWIKLYTELLSDPAFIGLTSRRRGILVGLWLEYGRSRRRLAVDARSLSHALHDRVTVADLKALNDAGFLAFSASNPASNLASNSASKGASLEKSREESPLPPAGIASTSASRDEAQGGLALGLEHETHEALKAAKRNSHRPKTSTYTKAETFTRQTGLEYPYDYFVDELGRFELSDDERERLITLWGEISPEVTAF